jgi:hypothetical protein
MRDSMNAWLHTPSPVGSAFLITGFVGIGVSMGFTYSGGNQPTPVLVAAPTVTTIRHSKTARFRDHSLKKSAWLTPSAAGHSAPAASQQAGACNACTLMEDSISHPDIRGL